MEALKAWLPKPRSANTMPVDLGVAVGLAVLAVMYLRSRTAGGDLVVGVVAILGAAILGAYSATVPLGSRRSVRGIALAVLAGLLSVLPGTQPWVASLVPVSLPVAIFLLTRAQASRQLGSDMIARRAQELERDQEARTRTAIVDERARMARELHDVVAHSVGVMVVQAQGAERILDSNPEAARTALQVISHTGREAVAEMHRLVGILRATEDGRTLTPQPGLGQLDSLLDQTEAAGLPVELKVDGDQREISPGVDLAAFRIVQEALTNTRKHAGATRATVRIQYTAAVLELEITDDGRGASSPAQGSGNGLVGMSERVALYDGKLKAAPLPGGGFGVFATLPLSSDGG